MDAWRSCYAMFVVVALLSFGCESESTDLGPTPVCVSVGGVWDVSMRGQAGTGINCPDRNLVWTLYQDGCTITIASETWDPANGAAGGVMDTRLYVEWTWFEGCYRHHESIDVVVEGDTMAGTYYRFRGQAVFPAYCPGLGMCSAVLTGVRRTAP